MRKTILLIVIALSVSGLTVQADPKVSVLATQPPDERKVQDQFPQSHHQFWQQLDAGSYSYNEKTGLFSSTIPDSVKALNGQEIELSGFMLPFETTDYSKHFLLSKRTPLCFFHMPGGPADLIEVFADKPVEWGDDIIVIKGTFTLTSQPEKGIFYQIKNAQYLKTEKVDWKKYRTLRK